MFSIIGAQMTHNSHKLYRYKAFISYNHRDKKFAKYLHAKLENYSSPGGGAIKGEKSLYPIFLDENELRAGSSLSNAIQDAIKVSEFLIVICSKNSVSSPWVKAELEFMKTIHANPKIIGVIPHKSGDETHIEALFGEGSGHLGADFRRGNNRYLQLSKIAATMSDVGLDTLYKRANRRKNKQMFFMGTGLTAIAALMSGLAFNAYVAETEAVRQRQHSEEVIAFMIDEFRDDLEELERLDILDDIGQRAQTYFEDRQLASLSDDSILLQSKTLRQLSDVDEKRGNLSTAKERIIAAYEASKYMVEKREKSVEAFLIHAENTAYWVFYEYQLGDLVKAESLSHEVLDIYDEGLKFFPKNEQLIWERSLAEHNVGVMLLQLGKADEAKPHFEHALDATKLLETKRALTEDERYDYVNLYTWYIRSLPDSTPLSSLVKAHREQIEILKKMNENGAPTIRNRTEILNIQRAIVKLLLDMGEEAEAERLMLSIQDDLEKLLVHDPENIGWRHHLMRSKLTLAELRHKNGHVSERNQLLQDVKVIQKKANGEDWPTTTDIVLSIDRLEAHKLCDEGAIDAAIVKLEKAEKDIWDYRKDKIRPRDKHNIASLKNMKAELLIGQNRESEAHEEFRAILDLLSEKSSYSINEQKIQLTAYNRLGETEKSLYLQEKLENRGVALDD